MVKFDEFCNQLSIDVPEGVETADLTAGEPPTQVTWPELCKLKGPIDEDLLQEWATMCETDDNYCIADP